MIQSLIIIGLAILALNDSKLKDDRVFGYSEFGGDVSALGCGYFLWDTYVSLKYAQMFGLGFAFHGIASLSVFLFGFVASWFSWLTLATLCNVLGPCIAII